MEVNIKDRKIFSEMSKETKCALVYQLIGTNEGQESLSKILSYNEIYMLNKIWCDKKLMSVGDGKREAVEYVVSLLGGE